MYPTIIVADYGLQMAAQYVFFRLNGITKLSRWKKTGELFSFPDGCKREFILKSLRTDTGPRMGFGGCTLWGRELSSRGLEACDSSPSSAEVKKTWITTSTFPHAFMSSKLYRVDSGLKRKYSTKYLGLIWDTMLKFVWGCRWSPQGRPSEGRDLNTRPPEYKNVNASHSIKSLTRDVIFFYFLFCSSAVCIRIRFMVVVLIAGEAVSRVFGCDALLLARIV
jgi:hypothetical protein